uniref:ARAD1A16566p n=1 Tax=Blastobotrys adeninivorans TaxID=409370 RepID=A0A060T3K6_BLAAD
MSDSRYSYDEKAEVWPYFAVTLLSVVLVPTTVVNVRRLWRNDEAILEAANKKAVQLEESARPHNFEEIEKFKRKERRQSALSKTNVFIAVGWVLLAYFVHVIYVSQQAASGEERKLFDPYEILGVSFSATEKQIKSTYRKLSLQFHPDKIRDLGNRTMDEIEEKYVEITKAYKALTDEVTRENFLKYGHPDGPQQTSHGIALPKFLVEGKGSPVVIASYALFVGIVLPWVVGSWWAGARAYTRTGIHQKTAADFFEACAKDQAHFVTYDRIVDLLSSATEYTLLVPHLKPAQIRQLIESHLNRTPSKQEADKLVIVARAPKILAGYLDIAAAFKDTGLCTRVVDVSRCIVQAVPIADQAYGAKLQLPGVSIADVEAQGNDIKLSPAAVQVGRKTIPTLHLVKAFFRVPGENGVVPPQSQSHLVIKFAVLPLGAKLPEIPSELLEDDDEKQHKILQEPLSTNNTDEPIPHVHAPYFPTTYTPVWYGFISNERDGKLIDGPTELKNLSFDNLQLSDKELADGTKIRLATFKIQLTSATPPMVGEFSFRLSLLSSGYFGCDIVDSVKMKVENPPPVSEQEDYDISDPEEDSVAGAMEQLKGGNTKASSANDDDSSDEEEDLSDFDTDTEDEA